MHERGKILGALALALGAALFGCRSDLGNNNNKGAAPVTTRPIDAVLLDHTNELMAIQGVVGVYQGETDDGKPCIKVMVVEETHELAEKIPDQLEGYPVAIEAGGEIRPMTGK